MDPNIAERTTWFLRMVCAHAGFLSLTLLALPSFAVEEPYLGHGIAMHGDLKYGASFPHFDYVNPQAPSGGDLRRSAIGSFDSFNPFIIKGNPGAAVGQIYDTLLVSSADEPFSAYGLLAESVEVPADRSWVAFELRSGARWHDGKPITVDDVIWSFETLRTKGAPFFRAYYASVSAVDRVGERKVRFRFEPGANREMPLILGQFPVLPKHFWKDRTFDETSLEIPLGSGPYRIAGFEPGRWIRYERVDDYWARSLPVNVGRHNFGTKRYDYYRDATVALEAFKAGEYDFRLENSAKEWATAYDFPALRAGWVRKEKVSHTRPSGMQGFAYNTRRELFRDARVRRALAYGLDFEWSNETLFHGQYTRTRSYFDNSELAATGVPEGPELAILEPYRGRVPGEVFTTPYEPPRTDGAGGLRANLRRAVALLGEAGWRVDKESGQLTHAQTGRVMEFEVLLVSSQFERITLPFAKNLERLGVTARVRTVDTAQYRQRLDDFDFDMVVANWGQSLSPGNEQLDFWGSELATQPGSRNVIGIREPVVDELILGIVSATTRDDLVAHVHALDRVLQWGDWVIPQWHIGYDRLALWDKFGFPAVIPAQGVQFDAWWIDAARAAALEKRRGRAND